MTITKEIAIITICFLLQASAVGFVTYKASKLKTELYECRQALIVTYE